MLEPGELRAVDARARLEEGLDLDDRGNRVARVAEELHTHGADVLRHPVQHPARRRDYAIAPFFLHAGQTAEKLVGHILAETGFAELAAFDLDARGPQHARALRYFAAVLPGELEDRHRGFVNLAAVVREARDLEPVAFGIDHAPPGEIVDRGAPQHCFLAAGVHRDIAADTGSVGRSRIDCEYQTCALGSLGHTARHHAGFGKNRRHWIGHFRQRGLLDSTEPFELLGVDHRRERRERDGAARVTRAAAARNDGQPQLDAPAHERRNLDFGIRREHHERKVDAPVGGIGHVRDARERIEAHVVGARVPFEQSTCAFAQLHGASEILRELMHALAGRLQQLADLAVALDVCRIAPPLHFVEAMMQSLDEQPATPRVLDEIVLQVRIALHDPDVAEHFVQHARRTPGATLAAQLIQDAPGRGTEQTQDDLAIGKRRVVVRNLAQAHGQCEL